MQGIFINGRRPKSKKEVKETIAAHPEQVYVEGTAITGRDFDDSVIHLPPGQRVYAVGPDPHTNRRFYLTIERRPDGTLKMT